MKVLLEQIDAVISGPGIGRSTDVRVQAGPNGQLRDDRADHDPRGWIIAFPDNEYGDGAPQEMGGPVAVALVGHKDMSIDDFEAFVRDCHKRSYEGQAEPTPTMGPTIGDTDDGMPMVDLRKFARHGAYERGVRHIEPQLNEMSSRFLGFIDQVAAFPMATGILANYKDSGNAFLMHEVDAYLRGLMGEMSTPKDYSTTMGNTVDKHPENPMHWRLP